MNSSSFWHDRRVLVLGCAGFLGSHVVRKLVDQGAAVVGLVHHTEPPLDADIHTVRGPADPGRIRSLLAIQQPAVVFQLVASAENPHLKAVVTADLLRAAAEQSSDAALLTPVAPTERPPQYQNRARNLRVGFVTLPALFGPGDRRGQTWPGRLFQAAAARRPLPRPTDGAAAVAFVEDAADSLLAAAEALASLPEPAANGLRLTPPAAMTASELYELAGRPLGLAGHLSAGAVRDTLAWYQSQPPARDTDVPTRAAA